MTLARQEPQGTMSRMDVIRSGYDGRPWPALAQHTIRPGDRTVSDELALPGTDLVARPAPCAALWLPREAGVSGRPVLAGDGWADPEEAELQLGWSAVLDGCMLTVNRPGEDLCPWFEGELLVTRDWRRAAARQGALLLISGPFANVTEVAAATRELRAVIIPVRLADSIW